MVTPTRSEISALARASGLEIAAVTSAAPFDGLDQILEERRLSGKLDGMSWFTAERSMVSANPAFLHDRAQSIISVGVPYYRSDIAPPDDGVTRGRIARYAWGADYHTTLKTRMSHLVGELQSLVGREIDVRVLVDTARIVDRAVAARAGLGWYGKHTNLIVPGHGSFVMLGEILIDVEIEASSPLTKNCGSCQICISKCPTNAIVEPYVIDAPRCISFQTIENRGSIPVHLRSLMTDWVFGCDTCQDVCPYTGAAKSVYDEAFAPRSVDNAFPSLVWLLEMSDKQFTETFRGTAVKRTKRSGLARNAAIAIGNLGQDRDFKPLANALASHDLPLVRQHAAWGLGHRYGVLAKSALEFGLGDPDESVRSECRAALENLN